MKYCPICDERYDDEIIRFCTKDGTPLVDDEQPKFTALPSENVDQPDNDFGEETIIRRKAEDGGETIPFDSKGTSERIVIPTSKPADEPIRPRTTQAYYTPPPPPNTVKTVILTILGTLAVLGFGAGLFWLFQIEEPANINLNLNGNLANQNVNLNTNLGFDSNFNFNTESNFNTDFDLNTNQDENLRTPTPTPRPTPDRTPSPTPTQAPTVTPTPVITPGPTVRLSPTPPGTPRLGPRPPTPNINRPEGNGNN